jgi:hypothetical protein
LTLSGAFVYIVGAVLWMRAPVLDVLGVTATMALLPLGLAWLCTMGGKRLREKTPRVVFSPAKRWLLACIGIGVVIVCATLVRSGMRAYQWRMDRSRNVSALEVEMRNNAVERVCTADLERFDISFRSIATASRKLVFTPVDLTHTPFARLPSLGGKAESVGDVASRLYRGFRMPDGHRLTLFEHDMSADGSRAWRDPKDEPERINGLPARLAVLEDSSGRRSGFYRGFRANGLTSYGSMLTLCAGRYASSCLRWQRRYRPPCPHVPTSRLSRKDVPARTVMLLTSRCPRY